MKDDQLPRLRCDDGDVIIKLSTDRDRHLLVHSDVIRIGLPILAPALKPEWSVPEAIEHPRTGKKINVYSLALKSVDQTILLEGKVCVPSVGTTELAMLIDTPRRSPSISKSG